MPPIRSELKVRHEGWMAEMDSRGKNLPSFFSREASEGKINAITHAAPATISAFIAGMVFESDSSEKPRMMSSARNGVVSTAAIKRKRMWSRAAYQAKKM